MKRKDSQNTYERCVLCGTPTKVPIMMPVDCRQHYVEGVGQLCEPCFMELKGLIPYKKEKPSQA